MADFDLSIQKLNDLSYDFNPTTNIDNELYFEKFIRIGEQLKKKKRKKRKKTNKLHKSKTFAF